MTYGECERCECEFDSTEDHTHCIVCRDYIEEFGGDDD